MPNEEQGTGLTLVERADKSFTVGGRVMAMIPNTFEAVWTLSQMVCEAGMQPGADGNKAWTPPMCAIAIMHGMEVGMTPLSSLQSIAVINGRPTIWGDGALALVMASPLYAWHNEWVEGDDQNMKAFCETGRKTQGIDGRTVIVTKQSYSWAEANEADLLKKDIWKKYRRRMMQMRARAFCLRDAFADVLRGLSIREEVEDYDEPARVTYQRPEPTKSDLAGKLAEAKAKVDASPPQPRRDDLPPLRKATVIADEVEEDRPRPADVIVNPETVSPQQKSPQDVATAEVNAEAVPDQSQAQVEPGGWTDVEQIRMELKPHDKKFLANSINKYREATDRKSFREAWDWFLGMVELRTEDVKDTYLAVAGYHAQRIGADLPELPASRPSTGKGRL